MNGKFMRSNFYAFVFTFVLVILSGAFGTAWAADITLSQAVVINSSNSNTYNNKSVAGTIPADSVAGENGNFISKGAIVVDGIELNLTIDGLNVDYSELYSMCSGISLVNGAKLHLTVKGTNNLKAGYGGAGIAVPDGCTLEITAASTGTLNVTGGNNYGGGAGIGSIGDCNNTNQANIYLFPQGLGTITINGGTINAQGGTWYYGYTAFGGAAGIGSSELSGSKVTGVTYGDNRYLSNNITGSITINGGEVNATGGTGAAGIGGGNSGTLTSITITGGNVTATGRDGGAAIGLGFNSFPSDGDTLTCPAIELTGGNITANGNIGYGKAKIESNNVGGSVTIGSSAVLKCTGTIAPIEANTIPSNSYVDADGNLHQVESPTSAFGADKWGTGWYVVDQNITVNSRIIVNGEVNLILNEGFTLTANEGIKVGKGSTLNIYAQMNGTGKIIAKGVDLYVAIGGGEKNNNDTSCGTINIYGGTIEATGNANAAGIGCGYVKVANIDSGTVNIYGGTITAHSSGGAGIGSGTVDNTEGFTPPTINIFGGTILAYSSNGAGIGGGDGGSGGTIKITGGNITASSNNGCGIGYGNNAHSKGATIELGWTNFTDRIAATGRSAVNYYAFGAKSTIRLTKEFMLNGAIANTRNFTVKEVTLVPAVKITFDANGGSGTMEAKVAYGSQYTLPECGFTPAEGKVFNYWLADGAECQPGDTITVNADIVIKAVWKNTRTVTFISNGGSEVAAQTVSQYDKAERPASPTREGYYFRGWYLNSDFSGTAYDFDTAVTDNITLYAKWSDHSIWGKTESYTPDGSESNPYLISNADGWDMLCEALQDNDTWDRFNGKYFRLDKDITVTKMAGSSYHDFCGTFDGRGYTISLNIETNEQNAAPFRCTSGTASIKNLRVAGIIRTSDKYAAGLVAQQYGTLNIENCRVSVTISSDVEGDGTHAGFVAGNTDTLKITGSVFDGKLLGEKTHSCGGFVGWRNKNAEIEDSLFAPSEITIGANLSATFARNGATITNSYYTADFNDGTNYTGQGKQGYTVSADEGITIALASETAGVSFDGKIYAGSGETVSLTISGGTKEGYTFKGYKASAGTLTESDGKYSLTMPEGNVTITAELELASYGVRFDEGIAKGLMTADKETATYGEIVTLTVKAGYEAENLTVRNGETTIDVTDNEGGTYTFTMPAGDVSVTATVKATEYAITYNLDGGEVSTANPTKYTIETATFTLNNPTRAGYKFAGWTGTGLDAATKTVTISKGSTGARTYTATWKSLAPFGYTDGNTPDGSSGNPYVISGVDGWNLLADELNGGESYSGQYFRLDDDLTVTTMLGTSDKGFAGTFEGNSNTLTFNYDGADDYVAPFHYVNGGTIKDLTVSGTIKTSGQHVGGIVGQSSGTTTIEACNFVGKLLTTNASVTIGGGFVAENNGTLTISKSLYAPAEVGNDETEANAEGSATFSRNNGEGTSDITTSYYTRLLGTAQGKQGYTVTVGTGITISLAENSTNGLTYDGTIYAGSGEAVSLTISGGDTKEGYTFKGYKANAGTLKESGEAYSLTMPAANVTISAEFVENISYKDSDGNNATASDYTILTSNMTNLTAGTYVVKEDITVSALTLAGDVNLILCDGATLTITENISGANSLTIYGQTNGTGTLTAKNITLTENKNLSIYGGTLTVGTISVAGTVTVKNATLNNEAYDANGDSTTSYTVTFESNGGSAVASQTLKFKYGENVRATKPTDPTQANYDFVEWQLNGTAYDFDTAVTGDITLTAKWTATEYAITYNGTDGATFTTANPTKYTVETATFTLTNPTKNGSTFAGWTGTGLSEATKSVTITKGSTGARTYTATWTGGGSDPDPNAPTFALAQIILDGEIGLNFFMDLPSGVDWSKSYVEFDTKEGTSNYYRQEYSPTFTYSDGTKTYYGFRCYINAAQMADTITATFHNGDNDPISSSTSVEGYLNSVLGMNFPEKTQNLMNAIKDYGHYIQPMLSEANGWTLGEKFTRMSGSRETEYTSEEIAQVAASAEKYAVVIEGQSAGIAQFSASLVFDSETTINIYLTPSSNYDGSISAKIDGGSSFSPTYYAGENQGYYLVQIGNILAQSLGEQHTVTVEANGTTTIKVSGLSYVNTIMKWSEATANMKKAVTALYKFYEAAVAYVSD